MELYNETTAFPQTIIASPLPYGDLFPENVLFAMTTFASPAYIPAPSPAMFDSKMEFSIIVESPYSTIIAPPDPEDSPERRSHDFEASRTVNPTSIFGSRC